MYIFELEYYSWADMSVVKADYINGLWAIFYISEDDYDRAVEEAEYTEAIKKYRIFKAV